VIAVVLLVVAAAAFYFKSRFVPEVKLKNRNYVFLYIEQKDLLEDVTEKLLEAEVIKKADNFEWLAEKMGLRENLHPGKYRITNGMNVTQIVNLIRYKKEEQVKLSRNSQIRDMDEFMRYVDEKLAIGLEELQNFFGDKQKLEQYFGLNPDNSLAAIVP